MTYCFRLTFQSSRAGFFGVESESASVVLPDGTELALRPRNAEKLVDATRFHFEAGGFSTEKEAYSSGEKLRKVLMLLSCMLNLPLSIPSTDKEGAQLADLQRVKIESEFGIRVLNSFSGLRIVPEEPPFIEFLMEGTGEVNPSEPLYVLDAIGTAWLHDLALNERSKRAIEMIFQSLSSTNPSTQFLTTYLALEQVLPRSHRSEAACSLVQDLLDVIKSSDIDEGEKKGLLGAVAQLKGSSFCADFRSYAACITAPDTTEGIQIAKLAPMCTRLRNSIAHDEAPHEKFDIPLLCNALRRFVLMIIWTENKLPNLSVYRPGDVVKMNNFRVGFL